MYFNGVDDAIGIPNRILQNGSSYTVVTNLSPLNVTKTYQRGFTISGTGGSVPPTQTIMFNTGAVLGWRWYNDGTPKWDKAQANNVTAENHIIVSVYDNQSIKLYIDGQLISFASST